MLSSHLVKLADNNFDSNIENHLVVYADNYSDRNIDNHKFLCDKNADNPTDTLVTPPRTCPRAGKRLLVVPSALGYGPAGSGDRIPPNSALVFLIELNKYGGSHCLCSVLCSLCFHLWMHTLILGADAHADSLGNCPL